jgi:LAS superfamily LD-carboxypeptidase LdcB
VNQFILKYKFPAAVFFVSIFLVFSSLLLKLQKEREVEINHQRFLVAQEAQIKAEEKAKEDAKEKIYLMGKFDPSTQENFAVVPAEDSISGYRMYLRKETLDAFLKMQNAADKDDIDLKIASATRNFIYQKNLWNNKWTGIVLVDGKNLAKSIPDGIERFEKILEYSAAPGTSRHHWGTDIDINNANPEYFETKQGEKEYSWLVKNASLFGFCQPYDLKDNDRPEGYNEEKWHWSYLPLAKTFTEEYKNLITDADIKGFDGDQYVIGQNLIENHVLGINPDCF